MRILEELISILNIEYYKPLIVDNSGQVSIFQWKKVCITGSFLYQDKKISRDDLVIQLEWVGWDFMSSVSKKTDFLLAWEKAWSKLIKANTLWVEVIDLEYFYENI
jgi:DNA ligase (NAD+)